MPIYIRGDRIRVTRGAYAESEWIVAGVVRTLNGNEPRIVAGLAKVPGLLHILSPEQVEPISDDPALVHPLRTLDVEGD